MTPRLEDIKKKPEQEKTCKLNLKVSHRRHGGFPESTERLLAVFRHILTHKLFKMLLVIYSLVGFFASAE
jgi:hypothetical protein